MKNLETGQTVFYALDDDISMMSYSVVGWVNKQRLEDLIGFG